MVAAKKKGTLGEAAVASDCDLAKVVNPHVFTYPAVAADTDFWRGAVGRRGATAEKTGATQAGGGAEGVVCASVCGGRCR